MSPDDSASLLFSSKSLCLSFCRQSSIILSTCSGSNPGLRESSVISAFSVSSALSSKEGILRSAARNLEQ